MVIACHQTLGILLVDCDMTSTTPVPCSAGMGRCMFLGARKRADHLLRGCWLVEAWGVLLCPAVWRSTTACMASAESVPPSHIQCCVPMSIILLCLITSSSPAKYSICRQPKLSGFSKAQASRRMFSCCWGALDSPSCNMQLVGKQLQDQPVKGGPSSPGRLAGELPRCCCSCPAGPGGGTATLWAVHAPLGR